MSIDTEPARPRSARTRVEREGETLILRRRGGEGCAVPFLLLWMTIWTIGCGVLLYNLIADFKWSLLLFSIPFLAAWVGVAALINWMMFGRIELRIGRDGATRLTRAFCYRRVVQVPLEALREVEEYVSGSGEQGVRWGIRLVTSDRPLKFMSDIGTEERQWLLPIISEHLNRLGVRPRTPEELATTRYQPLLAGDHWSLEESMRSVTLQVRDRPSLGAAATFVGIALFWNSIIGVFLTVMLEEMKFWLLLFLLPFIVIGLVLLGLAVGSLFAGAIRRTWRLDANELTRRWQFGPLSRTRRWPVSPLRRLEIARHQPQSENRSPAAWREGLDWKVRLFNDRNEEVAALQNLSESQAAAFYTAVRRQFRL
jgi:energy-coupling factor transporter transmembrane protein EcfT